MTTRVGIEALIKRLEEAREGSRDLDEAIALALYPELERREVIDLQFGQQQAWYLHGHLVHVEYYTTSVDAALTLVPEGWMVGEFRDEEDGGAYGRLLKVNDEETDAEAFGGSRPLTLCIAALRAALSSLQPRKDTP